ncbi:redoxin domain-containing protein [candidate division KSB1 bacterium]|nr:redoxin domain-containing protein [candidate division KSB1 bacterium]
MRKNYFLVLVLALVIASVGNVFAQYQVGDHVDDFTLPDVNGGTVSLYDYSDQLVLLNFFATW